MNIGGFLATLRHLNVSSTYTGIISAEAVLNEPCSNLALNDIVRTNLLHGRYRHFGKISDDDMLDTFSPCAPKSIRRTETRQLRSLADIELRAMGLYWKGLSKMVAVPLDLLEADEGDLGDGFAGLQALETWSLAYE